VALFLLLAACGNDATSTTAWTNPTGSTNLPDAASSGTGNDSSSPPNSYDASTATPGPTNNAGHDAGTGGQQGQQMTSSDANTTMLASEGGTTTTGEGGTTTAGDSGSGAALQKSAGCGMAPPAVGSDTSIMVGSSTGQYTLDVPTNYDNNKAYPLILVWHGAGVTGTAFHGYLDMHTAVGNDAIVVTPECLDGGSTWPSDMSYPDALLAHFEASYCIDQGRLFTTGHSMGGLYTGQVGCERGDVFRGDAVLAAPHPTGACKMGTMAVMMSVGMSDPVASSPTEFPWWAMENGCNFSMTTPVDPMSFYNMALDESGTCVEYGGCGPLTPLRTCTFNGGHEIPPWVAPAIWNFFKKL